MVERSELAKRAVEKIDEISPKGKQAKIQAWRADSFTTMREILTSNQSLCIGCAALTIIYTENNVEIKCEAGNSPINIWKAKPFIGKPECNDYEQLKEDSSSN